MTRVKICGITNIEDALAAVEFGADALGFILVPESPRFVRDEQLAALASRVPPFVCRVGVCATLASARAGWARYLDAIQSYDAASRAECWPRRISAYRVKDRDVLGEIELTRQGASAILLDAYHPDKLGGSGETFNWELAIEAKERFGLPIILAGGLTPENVSEAVRRVRPYAVDVSSGVESAPGRKDHTLLKRFIEAVREADG